jgi:hypothetical protein
MIGVVANPSDYAVVGEFFELFKTPWEFWKPEKSYDVVLCTTGEYPESFRAQLLLVYSGHRLALDPENVVEDQEGKRAKLLHYKEHEIPVYGNCITFSPGDMILLAEGISGRPAVLRHKQEEEGGEILRVGYDLFEEINFLLISGQPVEHAGAPTLDLHIAFLRDQICAAGIPLLEIPPIPQGYRFIACLTHDVDHPRIRRHRFDHTACGFLYRASIGSLLQVMMGRLSVRALAKNWAAVLKWPFVQIGLARDFWCNFDERYRKIEDGLPSTYFVIPFAGKCGQGVGKLPTTRRAAGYGARDIEASLRNVRANGGEIGLHGIDAWLDSLAGLQELEEIRLLTSEGEIGVRIHWLCFNEQSPKKLEHAGASYDSTVGYRETVGYRAGTLQAYVPPGASSLMELPLHVMDTALFFPGYLGLTTQEADQVLAMLVNDAVRFGGCLTINWHDRSLAPERLWTESYSNLLDELRARGAWFATARQVVAWFRQRRSVEFGPASVAEGLPASSCIGDGHGSRLPALSLRTYNSQDSSGAPGFADVPVGKIGEPQMAVGN